MGKGWAKLGAETLVASSSLDLRKIKLPAPPKRVAVCAINDVLATSNQKQQVT
jgi:hypothetical protein